LEKIREKRRREIIDKNPCCVQGFLNYPNDRILRKKSLSLETKNYEKTNSNNAVVQCFSKSKCTSAVYVS